MNLLYKFDNLEEKFRQIPKAAMLLATNPIQAPIPALEPLLLHSLLHQ